MKYIIDSEYEDVRLDKFLRKHLKNLPLSRIFSLIRKNEVKINGKNIKENYRLKINDELIIKNLEYEFSTTKYSELNNAEKNLIKKIIVYENDNFLLFNKPKNTVVHKGTKHNTGLIELLKRYYKNPNVNLINRIDKATSGLVIVAKTLKYTRFLTEFLNKGKIDKYYLCIVKGKINKKSFILEDNIKREENATKISDSGKKSKTLFKVIKNINDFYLLEAQIFTGRHHQIRVQLENMDLPVYGDNKYSKFNCETMYLTSYKVVIKELNFSFELEDAISQYKRYLADLAKKNTI